MWIPRPRKLMSLPHCHLPLPELHPLLPQTAPNGPCSFYTFPIQMPSLHVFCSEGVFGIKIQQESSLGEEDNSRIIADKTPDPALSFSSQTLYPLSTVNYSLLLLKPRKWLTLKI